MSFVSVSPRAVLWDMDGTLIDSAEYHWLTWRNTFAAEGHPLTHDEFASFFGQRNDTILRRFLGERVTAADIVRIGGAKEAAYRQMVRDRGIEPLPGVRAWLERLYNDGWKQAVASSAPPANIETLIEVLDLGDVFQALASAEDVPHGKPAPDVFLYAASRLGVPPSRCIVVEDAPAGVEAGRRGGMRTIGIATLHPGLEADIVVTSLEDLPDGAFDRLLDGAR
jgi:beta-phosphoglucomutase family hydrolase